MCGRYVISVSPGELASHFNAALPEGSEGTVQSRLNAAPSEVLPVLLNEGARQIQLLKWGLIPRWADDAAIGNKLINARAETIDEKPSFKDAFKKRRCLVLADGFYEWKDLGGRKKQPIKFTLASGTPFAFAGLWETWKAPDGVMQRTFTIITTTPNELVAPVHDRMPVILRPDFEKVWLDNEAAPSDWLSVLVPFPAEAMTSEPVTHELLKRMGA